MVVSEGGFSGGLCGSYQATAADAIPSSSARLRGTHAFLRHYQKLSISYTTYRHIVSEEFWGQITGDVDSTRIRMFPERDQLLGAGILVKERQNSGSMRFALWTFFVCLSVCLYILLLSSSDKEEFLDKLRRVTSFFPLRILHSFIS